VRKYLKATSNNGSLTNIQVGGLSKNDIRLKRSANPVIPRQTKEFDPRKMQAMYRQMWKSGVVL
jgi:hypothetical protein